MNFGKVICLRTVSKTFKILWFWNVEIYFQVMVNGGYLWGILLFASTILSAPSLNKAGVSDTKVITATSTNTTTVNNSTRTIITDSDSGNFKANSINGTRCPQTFVLEKVFLNLSLEALKRWWEAWWRIMRRSTQRYDTWRFKKGPSQRFFTKCPSQRFLKNVHFKKSSVFKGVSFFQIN